MRVALIVGTPGDSWGGMETHCSNLAVELAELDHEVHVLAHGGYHKNFPAPVHFHPCPMSLGRRNPWLRWKIHRTLSMLRPDVVHAHGNKAATLAARTRQRSWQTVGTIHGTKSNIRIFSDLDKVIAVSQSIFQQIPNPRKYLIHNGVKRPAGDAKPFPLEGSVKVVSAGRLEPVKGFDRLLRAWEFASQSAAGAHLTIFGEGSQKQQLYEMTKSGALAESVTIAGYYPDIGATLEDADLLFISSEREGFPYILGEALVANCPVLSTPVSGCRELLPETALAKDNSVEAISKLLSSGLEDIDAVRAGQQALFHYAQSHLTIQAMTSATVTAYKD